mgnify:CR=1 FL=1
MKTVPKFYMANEDRVSAYTDSDLKELSPILTVAKSMWFNEWMKQGEEEPVNIVNCSWVQGNISASRSVEPALEYLRSKGIDCNYNDGWMD